MDSTYQRPAIMIIALLSCVLATSAEPPVPQGIRPSNILGGAGQHASFSFIRPGLTQTSYAFNGPSSHQAFSSSIGNPNLAQKTLPNVANALAYRNPGLGYFSTGPVTSAYASAPAPAPPPSAPAPAAPTPHYQQGGAPLSGIPQAQVYQGAPAPTQGQADQVAALQSYLQQQYQQQFQQQYQQQYEQAIQYQALQNAQAQGSPDAAGYHAQIGQLQALRQAQQAQAAQSSPEQYQQQLPEQIQLQQREQHQQQQQQQEEQTQNLLGVAYSSAPSVAHVKVSGNGYNFDF